MLTFMWGGDVNDKSQWSSKDQYFYVDGYSLEFWQ